MLSQTKWYGRLGEYGRCMHEMAPIWKVNKRFIKKKKKKIRTQMKAQMVRVQKNTHT